MTFIKTLNSIMNTPSQNTETKKENVIDTKNENPLNDTGFLDQFNILWLNSEPIIPFLEDKIYANRMLELFFRILLRALVKNQKKFLILENSNLTIPGMIPFIPVRSIIDATPPASLLLIIIRELLKQRNTPVASSQDTGDV